MDYISKLRTQSSFSVEKEEAEYWWGVDQQFLSQGIITSVKLKKKKKGKSGLRQGESLFKRTIARRVKGTVAVEGWGLLLYTPTMRFTSSSKVRQKRDFLY